MKVKVLFFATFRQKVGLRQTIIEIHENASVMDLKALVCKQFPALESSSNIMLVAVNREFVSDKDIIPPEAEVALFPPVSGGSLPTICLVTKDELDLDSLLAQITLPSTGAACVFSGMVRALTTRAEPHQTLYLEYEAYQPMAEQKMFQVATEIRTRWPSIEGILIVQRIGRLDPGTPTVIIACSSSHRDTGIFEAARYGIDRLKEIVPIWKKEVSPDGETWVEGEYHPEPGE